MKKAAKPMHFREVSKEILNEFGRKAHTATTHNELIRDERFVLVGRGVYALREWGHMGGVVREVIAQIIDNAKRAMKKEEIIEAVKKERVVKDNTILVNLQNPLYFKKNPDGTYVVKKTENTK
jgi:DNA-directed RNA polymerase delta subunit